MDLKKIIDKKEEAAQYMIDSITHICTKFEKRGHGDIGEKQACEYAAEQMKEYGCDRVYVAFKALGCDGTVSGCAGVFPEPYVAVNAAIERGDWEAAKLHQRQAARVVDILHAGANMAYFKAALTLRGLNGGHMRKPQLDLTQEEFDTLKADLEAFCADTGYSLKA